MCFQSRLEKSLCLLSIVTYLGFLPVFIYRTYGWYQLQRLDVFLSLVVLLIAPMLVVNLLSAILLMRKDDFHGKFLSQNVCVISHCSQFGMVWRIFNIMFSYERGKVHEFSLLMVGQVTSSFLPSVLLEGVLLKPILPSIPITSKAFVALGILTSALSFVLAQRTLTDKRTETSDVSNVKYVILLVCHTLGVICLFVSRCLSIVLFSYVLTFWIALLLGLHLTVCIIVSLVSTHLQLKKVNFMCVLRETGLMCLQVFDSVSSGTAPGKCVNVLFYTLLLVENILMTAVWVMTSAHTDITKLVTVMVMLSAFVIGLVLKFLCHSCTSSSSIEDSDTKRLQVRAPSSTSINPRSSSRDHHPARPRSIEGVVNSDPLGGFVIDSTSATVCATIPTRDQREIKAVSSQSNSTQDKSSASYYNMAFEGTDIKCDNPRFKRKSANTKNRKVTPKNRRDVKTNKDNSDSNRHASTKSKHSRKVLKTQRGYYSEEHTDIDSSNSRNTNTLDLSAQSNTKGNNSYDDQEHNAKRHKVINSGKSVNKSTPDLNTLTQEQKEYEPNGIRPKSCVPSSSLAQNKQPPDEWYKYWTTRWQKGDREKSVLTHCPDNNCDLFTDTTSYYDTLSYYYTVTSSHTSSQDSDCAQTWPPSLPPASQNYNVQLPEEKFSPEERISLWLQRSKQYFSQEVLKHPVLFQDNSSISSRFGSNRRTICGYQNKASMSSASSRRLTSKWMRQQQGQSEEYRIQFQSYMDSLKEGKKNDRVLTTNPIEHPEKHLDQLHCKSETRKHTAIGDKTEKRKLTFCADPPARPPRPPRPPRDINSLSFVADVISNSLTSPHLFSPTGISPELILSPKSSQSHGLDLEKFPERTLTVKDSKSQQTLQERSASDQCPPLPERTYRSQSKRSNLGEERLRPQDVNNLDSSDNVNKRRSLSPLYGHPQRHSLETPSCPVQNPTSPSVQPRTLHNPTSPPVKRNSCTENASSPRVHCNTYQQNTVVSYSDNPSNPQIEFRTHQHNPSSPVQRRSHSRGPSTPQVNRNSHPQDPSSRPVHRRSYPQNLSSPQTQHKLYPQIVSTKSAQRRSDPICPSSSQVQHSNYPQNQETQHRNYIENHSHNPSSPEKKHINYPENHFQNPSSPKTQHINYEEKHSQNHSSPKTQHRNYQENHSQNPSSPKTQHRNYPENHSQNPSSPKTQHINYEENHSQNPSSPKAQHRNYPENHSQNPSSPQIQDRNYPENHSTAQHMHYLEKRSFPPSQHRNYQTNPSPTVVMRNRPNPSFHTPQHYRDKHHGSSPIPQHGRDRRSPSLSSPPDSCSYPDSQSSPSAPNNYKATSSINNEKQDHNHPSQNQFNSSLLGDAKHIYPNHAQPMRESSKGITDFQQIPLDTCKGENSRPKSLEYKIPYTPSLRTPTSPQSAPERSQLPGTSDYPPYVSPPSYPMIKSVRPNSSTTELESAV